MVAQSSAKLIKENLIGFLYGDFLLKDTSLRNNEIFSKLLLILFFLLIIVGLLFAYNYPAMGHEASIYKSTPIVVWISMLLSITAGSAFIIFQVYHEKFQQSYLWKIGFILVYLCNIFIISLFIIRGYFGWAINGDSGSHIGTVYHLFSSGYLEPELIYPITHVYTTQLSQILGLDLIYLHKLIPLFFGILYVPYMYLFNKQILPEKSHFLMATLISFTFVCGWYLYFTPNTLANLLFPLVLYIAIRLIKGGGVPWAIMIVIMSFLYPMYHLVPCIAIVGIIAFLSIPNKILIQFNKTKYNLILYRISKVKFTLLMIILVWGITWISSFPIWQVTVVNIYNVLFEREPSQLNNLVSQINYAQGYGYSVTTQIIKKFGGIIVFVLIDLLCVPIILKKMSKEPDEVMKLNMLFSLYGPFVFFSVLIPITFLLDLGFGPIRFLFYLTVISTPFVGFYLATIMEKFKKRKNSFVPFIILLFIIVIFIHAALVVYPSSYVLEMSQHTTKGEFYSMNWLLNNRNVDVPITGITAAPYRFVDLLPPAEIKRQNIPRLEIPEEIRPPYHFGYNTTKPKLSTYYRDDVYLVILDNDKSLYADTFPKMAKLRWTLDDFERINTDVSVNKIYSNKVSIIYRVNAGDSKLAPKISNLI
ncbi:hypothetical protein EQO05_01595 [Methanosarcina sp. MSH10X1]|uniref:hypothetical protein n=1 Tax=Methanosarcina sp. MSH10X1 TaxID=2507075 RepID=UPI000FFB88BD|nr:hypothetical protein [Methanosarcina sp. MSH10X1]RXA21939.1 hypothetical protein EQO05_01595 [Methanosarcina sp. MSH10X1]